MHNGNGSGFEEETRLFFQERLRSILGWVGIVLVAVSSAMLAARTLSGVTIDEGLVEFLRNPSTGGVLPLALISTGSWFYLRGRALSARVLITIDFLLLQAIFALALVPYLSHYAFSSPGHVTCLATLPIIILVRATAVPSTGWRTFIFSLPAPVIVLVAQLNHGAIYAYVDGEPYSARYFAEFVALNQVLLGSSILGAVTASRVTSGLRQSSYKAARFGPYELGRRIGGGSMGEVFEATHAMLKRPTAIKLLRPEITGERTLKRFEQEVRQASRLTHRNTVSIYDYGRNGAGVFYYAMELLSGSNLREIVERDGPLSVERTMHVLSQTCGALSEAHARGIVHRDIKPENLMLCEQGGEHDVLKVLDFGLLKDLTSTNGGLSVDGVVIGSPETMAPEILSGETTPRADLYSLCAVGCYLLTGKPIFEAKSLGEFLEAHKFETPIHPSTRNPAVSAEFEELLLRNLRKDPAERHSDASSLRDDLNALRSAATQGVKLS